MSRRGLAALVRVSMSVVANMEPQERPMLDDLDHAWDSSLASAAVSMVLFRSG